jgi:hypothetical protein
MTNAQRKPVPASAGQGSNQVNVNQLGYYLDGWADLIEGMAGKGKEVYEAIAKGLIDRQMPDIQTKKAWGVVSISGGEKRAYIINQTSPGATTAIHIRPHGKDLFVSWRTYIKPVPNWPVVFLIGFFSLLIGFFTSSSRASLYADLNISLSRFLINTLVLIILGAGAVAVAGRIMRGSFLAFFFIEPNIFDAEYITAMGLSAHKTLLRSLDSSGIDVSKLRLKQKFQGGRRGEEL